MLKRTATSSLIALLLTSSVGIWLLFPLLQGYYRLKAHHARSHKPSELITLHLKSNDFKRVGDDEIEYQNLRYDIESESLINGIYEFRAHPDHLETRLLAFFDETWQGLTGTSEAPSPVSQFIQKMLSTDYFCAWTSFTFEEAYPYRPSPLFSYFMSDFWAYSASFLLPPEG